MTQNEKDLLLKDLCARLPYGVKLYCNQGTSIDRKKGWKLVGYREANIEMKDVFGITTGTRHLIILNCVGSNNNVDIDFINDEVKPYLFPMSSMTEEQKIDLIKYLDDRVLFVRGEIIFSCLYANTMDRWKRVFEWCIKNHFDICGLIPMGLAIDCTNLNIY